MNYTQQVEGVKAQLVALEKSNVEQQGLFALDNKLDILNKLTILVAGLIAANVDLAQALSQPERGANTLRQGYKNVSATGISESLFRSTPCLGVHLHAMTSNTGSVYVGNAGVRSDLKGSVLYAHETVWIPIDDVSKISIAVSVAGEGVDFFYLQHVEEEANASN